MLPRHPLNEAFTKVVESNRHLHCFIPYIRITMAKEHHLQKATIASASKLEKQNNIEMVSEIQSFKSLYLIVVSEIVV
jgi:hypothetical protein